MYYFVTKFTYFDKLCTDYTTNYFYCVCYYIYVPNDIFIYVKYYINNFRGFMVKPTYCCKLKKLRISNGYTQSDIAIILDIRQEQYSKYESGIHQLPIHLLIKLCKVYRVSADYVLDI